HRVPHDIKVGISRRFREWEFYGVVYPSHGADGIPDPNEMRFAIARESLLEVRRDPEVDRLTLDHANGVWDQALIALSQQADAMKHPAQGAGGIGAAAKTEHVDPVTRLERLHHELVGVRYVVGQPIAEGQADSASPPFADAGQRAPSPHRADAGMVISDLVRITNQHLIELDDVGLPLAELVAGTVAADN